MQGGFIKYIVIIAVILIVVFLSQPTNFRGIGKNIFSQGYGIAQDYLTKGSNWVKENVYPKISGEVQKRGETIKNEVDREKQKVFETIGQKIKNYFSGIIDNIFNFNR